MQWYLRDYPNKHFYRHVDRRSAGRRPDPARRQRPRWRCRAAHVRLHRPGVRAALVVPGGDSTATSRSRRRSRPAGRPGKSSEEPHGPARHRRFDRRQPRTTTSVPRRRLQLYRLLDVPRSRAPARQDQFQGLRPQRLDPVAQRNPVLTVSRSTAALLVTPATTSGRGRILCAPTSSEGSDHGRARDRRTTAHVGLDRTIDLTAVIVGDDRLGRRHRRRRRVAAGPARSLRRFPRSRRGWRTRRTASTTARPRDRIRSCATPVPTVLLLQAAGFFLFGASDADRPPRPGPARHRHRAAGPRAALRSSASAAPSAWRRSPALSPTLVYASRIASRRSPSPRSRCSRSSALLRVGLPGQSDDARRRWALLAGVGLAATFGSGRARSASCSRCWSASPPRSPFDPGKENAFRRAVAGLAGDARGARLLRRRLRRDAPRPASRVSSRDFGALAGLGSTVADWGRLLTTDLHARRRPSSSCSPSCSTRSWPSRSRSSPPGAPMAIDAAGGLPWTFFAGWFAVGPADLQLQLRQSARARGPRRAAARAPRRRRARRRDRSLSTPDRRCAAVTASCCS